MRAVPTTCAGGGLAAGTGRLRLGTLVSPVTYQHPSILAKRAVTVDHISAGRVEAAGSTIHDGVAGTAGGVKWQPWRPR